MSNHPNAAQPMHDALKESWERNAGLWRDAVRDDLIPSRKTVTNRAIIDAAAALKPRRVLDMGCGEGWLIRALSANLDPARGAGSALVGADGSKALVAAARAADAAATYLALDYRVFTEDPSLAGGPFDLVVYNFSLLDDRVTDVLAASRRVLDDDGVILVQTVHPRTACGDAPYEDGWRTEGFDGFSSGAWQPMPWYFRTTESWRAAGTAAGLALVSSQEPVDPARGEPASLLLTLKASAENNRDGL